MKKSLLLIFFIYTLVNNAQIITTVAGNGTFGYSGDGGLATAAELSGPNGVALDSYGNLYIADEANNAIRKVTTTGIISTFVSANHAGGIAFDASGNLFISDEGNHYIRKVTTAGIVHLFAGIGTAGYSGDGGAATAAELCDPSGIAFDATGNMYIADYCNHRIRMINVFGTITTFAGNGTQGFSGDGGQATDAMLFYPQGVACDGANNVYIADFENNVIRKVTTAGIISTIAGDTTGIGTGNNFGSNGDGGLAVMVQKPMKLTTQDRYKLTS